MSKIVKSSEYDANGNKFIVEFFSADVAEGLAQAHLPAGCNATIEDKVVTFTPLNEDAKVTLKSILGL